MFLREWKVDEGQTTKRTLGAAGEELVYPVTTREREGENLGRVEANAKKKKNSELAFDVVQVESVSSILLGWRSEIR